MSKFIRVFFYGNIYLGICAVALCIETNLLIGISLNRLPFYFLIFLSTCIYYTMIYVRSAGAKIYNERTIWYRNNFKIIKKILKIAIVLAFALFILVTWRNIHPLFLVTPLQFLLIISVPVLAGWYTYSLPYLGIIKIRQTGWIKPIIIGLTWTGWVTVYPLVIRPLHTGQLITAYNFPAFLLTLQNFLFFSINAIIFDIKDYKNDLRHHLKTFPVIFGIKNCFRYIILPAAILNIAVFVIFQKQQNFTPVQTCLQAVPYLLLIYTIISYREQRSVLYYLAAVDGLVFVKAVCGITSILLLKK